MADGFALHPRALMKRLWFHQSLYGSRLQERGLVASLSAVAVFSRAFMPRARPRSRLTRDPSYGRPYPFAGREKASN